MKQFYLNLVQWWQCVRVRAYSRQVLDKAVATKQAGLTLLEMIVVIALLSIVALSATTLIIDNGDLARQQATETRWNQIREAIISPPNLYLNGSPYVRGYVADMGRLPVSIFELIGQSDTTITYDEDDDAGTPEITIEQPDWTEIGLGYEASAGFENSLMGGWRGPYLYTAGHTEFRDGWGREEADADQDAFNFGWLIDTGGEQIAEVTDLFVQSLGSDQDAGGSGDFTEDFPIDPDLAIVNESEWTIGDSPITFNINFSVPFRAACNPDDPDNPCDCDENDPDDPDDPCDLGNLPLRGDVTNRAQLVDRATDTNYDQLVLRIFRYMDNGDATVDFNTLGDDTDDVAVITAGSTFTVDVADPTLKVQTITPLGELPVGRYAALIYCTNVEVGGPDPLANPNDDVVYDGDCNYDAATDPINHSPVYFTLTNNTSQVTITWDLP